jgi:hypothetical protein
MSETDASDLVLPPLLADRAAYQARLRLILPESLTATTATANLGAAAAAITMMYVGAIAGENPVRPLAFVRMSDEIAAHRLPDERREYYSATLAQQATRRVDALCAAWGVPREGYYAANSREGPRDETFHAWEQNGALLWDHTVKTTSSRGRYTLTPQFAELLGPDLAGQDLADAILTWQAENLTPIGRAKAATRTARAKAGAAVVVTLPGGATRTLNAGSETLAAFLQLGMPALMADPIIVFLSQSGEPVNIVDHETLDRIGLDLAAVGVLPDCLVVDVEQGHLWFVEVVDSDGPVDEERKATLLAWAVASGVTTDQCRFLTAFQARTHSPAKKNLPQLARGSFGWYADEPDGLLTWDDLSRPTP